MDGINKKANIVTYILAKIQGNLLSCTLLHIKLSGIDTFLTILILIF